MTQSAQHVRPAIRAVIRRIRYYRETRQHQLAHRYTAYLREALLPYRHAAS